MKEAAGTLSPQSINNHLYQKKSHKKYQSKFRRNMDANSIGSSSNNTQYDGGDVFDEKTEFLHTKDPSLRRIGLRQRSRPYVR